MDKLISQDKRALTLYGIGIAVLLLIADFFSGPFIQFPITYLIPVAFVAWFNGRWYGICFAIALPLFRLYFNLALWEVPWTYLEAGINCIIRILVLSLFAIMIDRTARQTRKLAKEVQLLEGLLPICSFCKKIRDAEEKWQPIEQYIGERSQASFSHGLCPDCIKKHYGDLFEKQ